MDRVVAIKVLPSQLAGDPEKRQRFEREARTISTLSHQHVCTLYDIGQQDGVDYLVLEYLEGETLEKRLEKGPLPTKEALKYAIELADALDKAHRQADHPSRYQARQHHAYEIWSEADGLRAGEAQV